MDEQTCKGSGKSQPCNGKKSSFAFSKGCLQPWMSTVASPGVVRAPNLLALQMCPRRTFGSDIVSPMVNTSLAAVRPPDNALRHFRSLSRAAGEDSGWRATARQENVRKTVFNVNTISSFPQISPSPGQVLGGMSWGVRGAQRWPSLPSSGVGARKRSTFLSSLPFRLHNLAVTNSHCHVFPAGVPFKKRSIKNPPCPTLGPPPSVCDPKPRSGHTSGHPKAKKADPWNRDLRKTVLSFSGGFAVEDLGRIYFEPPVVCVYTLWKCSLCLKDCQIWGKGD